MLETLRKQKRGVFGLIIVGFCGSLMLPFGLDMIRSDGNQAQGIQVNDTKLNSRQFYNRLQQIQESYRSQLGKNYPAFRKMLNLEQRTADDLVHSVLLDSFIEKLGLGTNVSQIEEKIADHPFFKETGINKANFETFLRAQGLNSAGLEAVTKREILVQQIDKLFADFSVLSKREQENLKKLNSRAAKFKYIEFAPEKYKAQVKIENDDKLKAFFKDHSEDYLTKKAVSFAAVAFMPQDFAAQVEVDENEIKENYDNDQNEYFYPAQAKIKQYVVNKDRFVTNSEDAKNNDADLTASTATAKEYIGKADTRIKAGEDFDTVVGKDSDQPSDAGWLDYRVLEPEVRKAISSLKAGEVSAVIETEKYFKIVKVEETKAKSKKPFEEVKASIEAKLRSDNAPEYARAAAENFMTKASDSNITDAAEKSGKKLISTPQPITQEELVAGITPNTIKQILTLQENDLEIVNDGDNAYVVSVNKVVVPFVPAFEKVADQIKEAVIEQEASEMAKKAAEQTRDSILAGTKLEDAAKANNQEVKKSDFLSKDSTATAPFSIDTNKTAALGLTVKSPVAKEILTEGGLFYIVELEEEKFEEPKEKSKTELSEEDQGSNRLFESLIKYLKSKANIKIDPALLESNS